MFLRRVQQLKRSSYLFFLLATTLNGCATISTSLGLRAKAFNESPTVQNPAITGKVDNLPTTDHNGGTYKMVGIKDNQLCIHVTREISETRAAKLEMRLLAFNNPEVQDDAAPSAKPIRRSIVSSDLKNYTYQATEQDTVRDSHGRTVAQVDRPVTRVGQYQLTTLETCYPMKDIITKETSYLAIEIKPEGLLDFGSYKAMWQFAKN